MPSDNCSLAILISLNSQWINRKKLFPRQLFMHLYLCTFTVLLEGQVVEIQVSNFGTI